jgi:hypothetical protein
MSTQLPRAASPHHRPLALSRSIGRLHLPGGTESTASWASLFAGPEVRPPKWSSEPANLLLQALAASSWPAAVGSGSATRPAGPTDRRAAPPGPNRGRSRLSLGPAYPTQRSPTSSRYSRSSAGWSICLARVDGAVYLIILARCRSAPGCRGPAASCLLAKPEAMDSSALDRADCQVDCQPGERMPFPGDIGGRA